MERSGIQFSVASMLGLVACVALNIWLFRFGALAGILGLNVSKHVIIAYLCQRVGVDREKANARRAVTAVGPPHSSPASSAPLSGGVTLG